MMEARQKNRLTKSKVPTMIRQTQMKINKLNCLKHHLKITNNKNKLLMKPKNHRHKRDNNLKINHRKRHKVYLDSLGGVLRSL